MPVDPERRATFAERVSSAKQFESQIITKADQLTDDSGKIPFGPMLTWATGGGLNIGHMAWTYGPEGSGKSLNNLSLISNAQNYPEVMEEYLGKQIRFWEGKNKFKAVALKSKLKDLQKRFPDGMSVLLFDTEDRFMATFAEQMGVTVGSGKLEISDEKIIENIADLMGEAMDAYHLIIVDSINNAESFAEAQLDPGQYERGTAAAAWKRIRGVRRKLDRKENSIMLVAQVRAPMGKLGQHGNEPRPEPPNIKVIKHNVSLGVDFDKGKKLYMMANGMLTEDYKKGSDDYKALGASGKEVSGLEIRCKITKNSTGKPFRNAAMRFQFPVHDVFSGEVVQEVGFDESYELAQAAEYFKMVEGAGGGMFYRLDSEGDRMGKGYSWKGEAALRNAIQEDEDFEEQIRMRMILDT